MVGEALYLGIIHDIGYSSIRIQQGIPWRYPECLLKKGLDTEEIIDGSFMRKLQGKPDTWQMPYGKHACCRW